MENHTLLWSFQMWAMWLQLWNLEQVCHTLKVCTWVAIYMFGKALDVWKRSIPEPQMIFFFLRRHASACVWPKESGVSFLTKLDAEELWFTLIKVWWNKKCQKLKSSKRIFLKIWYIYFDLNSLEKYLLFWTPSLFSPTTKQIAPLLLNKTWNTCKNVVFT